MNLEFRVWDNHSKKMIPFEEIWFKPNGMTCDKWSSVTRTQGIAFSDTDSCNGVLMVYSGLLDKNKKKIFEADIMKTYHGNYQVVFEYGRFELKNYDHYGVNGESPDLEELEIIGNVYENPKIEIK